MIYTGGSDEHTVENYKDYRNRTVKKHLGKIKNQVQQIKNCSLKAADKKKLLNELQAEINNALQNL
jgi:hypothetical protein